ncbi:unnamed protein product [Cyberlindnera jadinii]|uniref:Secreted protein n=1 Tax=Cyberlindnera jadinii (strain ATCC 18201 / CBS 1600 / BCRC 20928 / JCM 3617 / NBRC 0987 / NRRL Y-1542) TaxID=983966 RepID=A0A0H5CAL2_CYBJN|nr:unnamed protein product [Cyberlindnera jadinii]
MRMLFTMLFLSNLTAWLAMSVCSKSSTGISKIRAMSIATLPLPMITTFSTLSSGGAPVFQILGLPLYQATNSCALITPALSSPLIPNLLPWSHPYANTTPLKLF